MTKPQKGPAPGYELAIFDFDGTLADSFPFFVSIIDTLADRYSFKRVDREEVEMLRGRSPRELMSHLGIASWKLPMVAQGFMALMRERIEEIPLFDEVDTTLSYLTERGIVVALVSSNAHENIARVLGASCRHFSHFECGASIFGKASRLRRVLRRAGIASTAAIYIGDQPTDHEAAKSACLAFGAVAWGYGTREALGRLAPEEEFASVPDLRRIAGNTV
ncbi:HAD hydrolase-like protein [Pseudomonas sp. GCM10022188]|uniref:HAD hydrolase-like protein n=1 Tax=Pseudomonas TaxID=286 RepID=UPI001E5157BB|nr:HAD hydrolase-like protein [Pseudomonas oryzagri]MCC6074029.1 HAD hydrolase-like protein [Pseudomonas oryzagri]